MEKKAAQKISLKARALRYLSAREHSRSELAKKLSSYATEEDNVDALLDELEAAKFLSNERFTESLVNKRANRFGNARILRELEQHGIDTETVENKFLMEDETERALSVWRKKYTEAPKDYNERAKQMRFLQQRGFSVESIRSVFRKLNEGE